MSGTASTAGPTNTASTASPACTAHDLTFGQRFLERAASFGPVCVGIDPHASLLEQWGLPVSVKGVEAFTRTCVEAFRDSACVVKPQVAFYEAFGSAGFAILERAIADLRSSGVLVIADAKRGDIGSTMAGYARAWLDDESPLCVDAVTVSPYLGVGSLQPVFDLAEETNRGAIVLAATSNPEAPGLQLATVPSEPSECEKSDTASSDTLTVAQSVVDAVARTNAGHVGAGNMGVVVGATVQQPPSLARVNGLILMPGVGAQGGTMADVRRIAAGAEQLACPNVSRSVLSQGPDVDALRETLATTTAAILN
ncbi:orotidine-5'-phosphate decarboxylase [Corynebacterium falsenii]|uniref:orotidine-5'-phosphate decarboxylase n=1 Tax=Corynebacterium falsenii TaxID=108486 RepID=UPI001D3C6B12|nr:orotidine-5'-phosphate decarboxylase [Corynebacterium falsenii]HJF12175.1 orotidine-5'-phosphate decarboxylase [Corynebacterium falsenii]